MMMKPCNLAVFDFVKIFYHNKTLVYLTCAAALGMERFSAYRMDKECLLKFVAPFYRYKDIMHSIWHIDLVIKYVDRIISQGQYVVDYESLIAAAYFHGFIYSDELAIRTWLNEQNVSIETIERIITITWESQRQEVPQTLEGKILHDAHVIEGGKTYLITKSLITGSVRGQSLVETIAYIERNVLDRNQCYLPESVPVCAASNQFAKDFVSALKKDISTENGILA